MEIKELEGRVEVESCLITTVPLETKLSLKRVSL